MKILKAASAGTLESSDALITVSPADEMEIEIDSVVIRQFGAQIEQSVREVLRDLSIDCARVQVSDRGAVDCVLRARCEAAILRAAGEDA